MTLKEMIERNRAAKVARDNALDPVMAELDDCGLGYVNRGGVLRIPRGGYDMLVVKATAGNAYQWGINTVVPTRVVDLHSLLNSLAEYLA